MLAHLQQHGHTKRPEKERVFNRACLVLLSTVVDILTDVKSPLFLHSNGQCICPAASACFLAALHTYHNTIGSSGSSTVKPVGHPANRSLPWEDVLHMCCAQTEGMLHQLAI